VGASKRKEAMKKTHGTRLPTDERPNLKRTIKERIEQGEDESRQAIRDAVHR
jgi:hypothetical protein